ncbi:MAG: hypothetical protein QN178_06145 [Armatimonadota bacterium]|nr:hypothetical protein [Armatimonadota bacterium]
MIGGLTIPQSWARRRPGRRHGVRAGGQLFAGPGPRAEASARSLLAWFWDDRQALRLKLALLLCSLLAMALLEVPR